MRKCSDCQLCCKLLPMVNSARWSPDAVATVIAAGLAVPGIPEFDKPAGERCRHQRHGKGCVVYGRHPLGCQLWNCRWLAEDDTGDLRRPDRSGYVVDILPDFVTLDLGDGNQHNIEAVVIWAETPDAWRDPALLEYLIRRGAEGKVALIRFNERDGLTLFPPNMCSDGQWHEFPRNQVVMRKQHGPRQLFEGLAACRNVRLDVPK